MKKILLATAVFFLAAVTVIAQSTRMGFNAGVSLSNMIYKYDGSNRETADPLPRVTVGWVVDMPIGKSFSFQPGLNFFQKGFKEESKDGSSTEKLKHVLDYFEVPLNILYNTRHNKGNFFIGAGPSFAFGIDGKSTYTDSRDTKERTLKFGNSDEPGKEDDYKPFDFGGNMIAGYETKSGFIVSFNYNMSISNLIPGDAGKSSLRNNYFGFKAGWMIKN